MHRVRCLLKRGSLASQIFGWGQTMNLAPQNLRSVYNNSNLVNNEAYGLGRYNKPY